ncbi:MAG TPA: beta-N-acetylhexosaminidase [Firmicutes bacterium]|nr:beta-N-acetylhexosaminidase [Bacillota bacterium]
MEHLSLKEKVGQLMMFGFAGKAIPPHIEKFITEGNLGGIIHFSRNIDDPKQIRALNDELQALAKRSPSGLDLLISIDQEGGSVVRLTNGVSVSPGNMALGAADSAELAEQVGQVMGEELRAAGFNINLAPCLDVNNNSKNPVIGVRSFGSDPVKVAELGSALIRGLQRHLAAVGKHFPGHGDTHVDSHLSLPVIDHSWERLEAVELVPFKKAIETGVKGILAAHVFFPTLEPNPNLPATLSPAVLTKLLRERLGFTGLILTDCMEMEAITKNFSLGEAAVLTIEAGSDIVIVSHTPERQKEAVRAVVEAVERGRIPEERIDESLARIYALKKGFRADSQKPASLSGAAKSDVMAAAVEKSLTVVRGKNELPLQRGPVYVIETAAQATSIAEEKIEGSTTLADALAKEGFTVEREQVGLTVGGGEIKRLAAKAANHSLVIIVAQDAHRHAGQAEMIRQVAAASKTIVIGARTPYELTALPNAAAYIAVYTNRAFVWPQVAALLVGKIKGQGRLPVTLNEN